jgi:hypothetical protein
LKTMSQTQPTSPRLAAATGVCGALHRAYRDRRLYPPEHPTAGESVADFFTTVDQYLQEHGPLRLGVLEDALVMEGTAVYHREDSRDNLAFMMFRDGIRSLVLYPGCETDELERIVDCLANADNLASMDHNLVTALWEGDIAHLDYQVVDPFMGAGSVREGLVDALRETVLRRLEMVETQSLARPDITAGKMRRVGIRYYDDDALHLTPEETERGEREVAGLASGVQDYTEVLLEIAGKVPITSSSDAVIQSLGAVVGMYLEEGNIDGALFVLDHLGALEMQRWVPGGSVGFVAESSVTAAKLLDLLDSRLEQPGRAEKVTRLLLLVRRWITPALLEILAGSSDRSVRKMVLDLLGDEHSVPWRDLEPLLHDQRWYVVRNAVHLAADMGHEEMTDHTARLLAHPDMRVRRETVRALGRLNGQATVKGLGRALSDSDPSVRILAANALGRKGGAEQRTMLRARIEDRAFFSLSAEEIEAFLGAYAELAQDKALTMLERMWKKGLFSSKPMTVRVAAVLALGRIRASAAQTLLQSAAKSDDPHIKRAAIEGLQRRAGVRSEDS